MAAVSGGLETMELRVLCIQCSPGSLDSEFVNMGMCGPKPPTIYPDPFAEPPSFYPCPFEVHTKSTGTRSFWKILTKLFIFNSAAEFRKYCKRLHVDLYTKRKRLHAKL